MQSQYPHEFTGSLFQETEFKVGVKDLLGAPVDAIVNPANSGLSHGAGLAALISEAAGQQMEEDCERILEKIGKVPVTIAVPTRAGDLPQKGVIHAVGPRMGDGEEQEKLEKTFENALVVAHRKGWGSVAFPAMGTGIFAIPKEICARAFVGALDAFWQNEERRTVNLVWLCLTLEDYPVFLENISI